MREIRTLRVMWRGLGTELRYGLRHRCLAKAAGNCYSPDLRPPHQDPTLPRYFWSVLVSSTLWRRATVRWPALHRTACDFSAYRRCNTQEKD